jgi:hypothetical protein
MKTEGKKKSEKNQLKNEKTCKTAVKEKERACYAKKFL